MLTKYASFEVSEVLDVKGAPTRQRTASLDKIADFDNYRTSDGYLYARIRAISSRVNKNHDGWPSVELAGSKDLFERHHGAGGFTVEAADGNSEYGFSTFVGKPIFVDHHNSNPKKARGVIVDAKLNVLDRRTASSDDYWSGDADTEHLPPTEVELLLEVDADSFPKLAEAIVSGDLDGFSMGCDVEYSKCSHCGHEASSPDEYCSHIVMKGAIHDFKTAEGKRVSRKSYENCYGIKFFEISAVFDPADETALAREVRASVYKEADLFGTPEMNALNPADPVRPPGRDMDIELEAMRLQQEHGFSPQRALELAQEKLERQQPTPGGGDGQVWSPKIKDYMRADGNAMPLGPTNFPPPRTPPPHGVNPEFFDAANQALDDAYPKRPIQNYPRWSATHEAQNPLPQSFETTAPDTVDTLREEQLCPICGNDMDSETCQVCGYVEPPKEYDNPDLNKAEEIRDEMKQKDEQAATPQDPSGGQPSSPPPAQGGPLSGPATNTPTKPPATAHVKSDMRWTPKVHPKTAARINQVEMPVSTTTVRASDEPKKETVTSDQTRPVTAAMQTAQQLMARAQRNHSGDNMNTRTADGPTPPGDTSADKRVDVTGVGGVDQASNEEASKARAQVDVTGIGSTGVTDVSADATESLPTAGENSNDSGFNKDKTTDDSGPTKTFGDSDGTERGVSDPVTSDPFPRSEDGVKSHTRRAYDDKTLEQNEQQGDPVAQGGSAVKGTQPVAETFGERVNLLEHKTSPENNSGKTDTWSGTDGNGVTKQQPPVTREDQEWGGVKVPDVTLHTTGKVSLSSLRLTRAEIELGITLPEQEWNRIAQLETESEESKMAQIKALSGVKTAGLAKLAQQRQAGVRRLPTSFGKNTAAPHGFERIASDTKVAREEVSNEMLDSALFLR